MSKYKFMDFCAGIGGGRLGLTSAGLTCVAYSEIDNDAEKTYDANSEEFSSYSLYTIEGVNSPLDEIINVR